MRNNESTCYTIKYTKWAKFLKHLGLLSHKSTEEVRGQTMPLTPPRSKGLLPSLSITIIATPVIANCNSKEPR